MKADESNLGQGPSTSWCLWLTSHACSTAIACPPRSTWDLRNQSAQLSLWIWCNPRRRHKELQSYLPHAAWMRAAAKKLDFAAQPGATTATSEVCHVDENAFGKSSWEPCVAATSSAGHSFPLATAAANSNCWNIPNSAYDKVAWRHHAARCTANLSPKATCSSFLPSPAPSLTFAPLLCWGKQERI